MTKWLGTANAVTGLYPFMSLAVESKKCNSERRCWCSYKAISSTYLFEKVYKFAMMNLNSIQSDCVPEESKKSKATNERTRSAKRVKLA